MAASRPGSAATSGTVVTATVPSATTLVTGGCPPETDGVTDFGIVQPGDTRFMPGLCQVQFGSSNDSSSLRIAQRDGEGRGMWSAQGDAWDTTGFAAPTGHQSGAGSLLFSGAHPLRLADGSIIVPGSSGVWPDYHPALQKYEPDGDLDLGFGGGTGSVSLALGVASTDEGFGTVVEQADGKLVAAGAYVDVGSDQRWVLARFDANGALDTATFNPPLGYVTMDLPQVYSYISDVAIDSQQRIVVVGRGDNDQVTRFARYLADGSLDVGGFGAPNGYVDYDHPGCCFDRVPAMHVDDEDRITWAGSMGDGTVLASRYDADGTLDTSFGSGGTTSFDFDGGDGLDIVGDFVPRRDGGWIGVGQRRDSSGHQGVVFALDANGDLDIGGFAAPDGYRLLDMSPDGFFVEYDDYLRSVVELEDGSIAAAGLHFDTGSGNYRPAVVLLRASGSVATDFGSEGVRLIPESPNVDAVALLDDHDGRLVIAGNAWIGRLGGETLLDYGVGGTWGAGTNAFGACLVAAGSGATTDGTTWTPDPDADCFDADLDPWNAIPETTGEAGATVARAAQQPGLATVDLRFGVRMSTAQRPGRYVAPIAFEVVAPAA